jgi:site-specific recombinase XerD
MTFDDAFREYLHKHTDVRSEGSVLVYLRIARRIMASRKTPAEWLTARFSSPGARGTVLTYLGAARHLHAFLKIVKPARAGEEPNLNQKKAIKKRQVEVADALNDERLAAYLRALQEDRYCSPEARCILALMPFTGLRINEACTLERSAIQRKGTTLVLHIRHGKGDKERFVPLGKHAARLIQAYIQKHRTTSKWMFPSAVIAGDPITPSAIRGHHRRVRARLGDGWETMRTHDLRHTFASRLIARGVPIEAIQNLLGHDSIRTTQGYVHSDAGQLKKYVDALDVPL